MFYNSFVDNIYNYPIEKSLLFLISFYKYSAISYLDYILNDVKKSFFYDYLKYDIQRRIF